MLKNEKLPKLENNCKLSKKLIISNKKSEMFENIKFETRSKYQNKSCPGDKKKLLENFMQKTETVFYDDSNNFFYTEN